ncbi:NAC domain-containing protein 55-like [Populus nigra]|uniref:NAC domain-containing protein 55-like n=1 Tax=Populus nigra TaxID=3691 RepID=UPI002B26CFFD|nr:NAC domain-containing protein 55-like [Populus nigra]
MEDQRRGAGLANPVNNSSITYPSHAQLGVNPGLVQGDQYPPGYRFKPKDQELISCYLLCKIRNRPLPRNGIHEVTLYKYNPETLAGNYEPYGEKEWYFLTPRDRKYPNGDRPNRAAGDGYWKATGADTDVISANQVIGSKRTLVFYRGKAPGGDKTNWIMHEYRARNSDGAPKRTNDGMRLDEWVLCRIHNRNDGPPTNRINGLQDDEIEDQPSENNGNLVPQQVVVPSISEYHNPGSQLGYLDTSYGNSVSAFPQNSQNELVAGVSQNHAVYSRNTVTGNFNPGSQMGYLDSYGNSQNGLVAGVSQDHAVTSVATMTGNYNPVSQMGYLGRYGNFAFAYPHNSQNGLARVSQDNALPGIPQTTNLQLDQSSSYVLKTILDYEISSFQFGNGGNNDFGENDDDLFGLDNIVPPSTASDDRSDHH